MLPFQWIRLLERIDDCDEPGRQTLSYRPDDDLGHMFVVRLGDTARNRGLRVGVTAKRHSESNRILNI